MKKAWIVARVTYGLGVRSGTFLMLTFGVPLLMLVAVGAIGLQAASGKLPTIGYVDLSGKLSPIDEVQVEGEVLHLKAYPDVAAAQSAQIMRTIDAYLVVPAGYFQGEAMRYYGKDDPRGKTQKALEALVRRGLLPDVPQKTMDLLEKPLSSLTFVASESGATVQDGLPLTIHILFPFALAGLFGFLVMTNVSQMGTAMVREKDNRAMEILLTSLPAWQLVLGKVLAVTLLSLTQIAAWAIGGIPALSLALARWAPGESIVVPLDVAGWALALFLPGYFLYVTLAVGVGILAGNTQQAQQVAGAFGVFAMAPFFVLISVISAPNGPLAVGLSLFPLTAPMIALLRMGGTSVPTWQLLTAIGLIIVALLGSIWLVARLFRAAVLLYGQPIRPDAVLRALRGSRGRAEGGIQ